MTLRDRHARELRDLRVSVTDRCNLRCAYCMPAESYTWLERKDVLSFEEIAALVASFCDLGVNSVRLTGGEPLLRRDLPNLVALLGRETRLEDIALTTNGVLLADQAEALRAAGLHRVTVSLDTLRPDRFRSIAQRDELQRTLEGIEAARVAGFRGSKLDTVVMRDFNDDELIDLIEFGKRAGIQVRFIEYMDVGGATHWSMDKVVSRTEILERLESHYGPIRTSGEQGSAPARRYRLGDGTVFGIIASTTEPFCGACDRSRLTADGMWYLCLYARIGLDLRKMLRAGAERSEITARLAGVWSERTDRGAEDRLATADRGAAFDAGELEADPHLEMHTRGG